MQACVQISTWFLYSKISEKSWAKPSRFASSDSHKRFPPPLFFMLIHKYGQSWNFVLSHWWAVFFYCEKCRNSSLVQSDYFAHLCSKWGLRIFTYTKLPFVAPRGKFMKTLRQNVLLPSLVKMWFLWQFSQLENFKRTISLHYNCCISEVQKPPKSEQIFLSTFFTVHVGISAYGSISNLIVQNKDSADFW